MLDAGQELTGLLARFGMMVSLDTSLGADQEFHASRAEQDYRDAGRVTIRPDLGITDGLRRGELSQRGR